MQEPLELTILMPCLDEAETLATCIGRARKLLQDNRIQGEILISDNGSSDGSQAIAEKNGARVVNCPLRGYGAALQFGIEQARGKFVLMGDSDDSYHFDEAFPMIEKLREGFDVCLGTRLKGKIVPGAMPFLNQNLGNPVLTLFGRVFFNVNSSDFYCGMRAFRRDLIPRLNLQTMGMEWAIDQMIKSKMLGAKITEVPITLYPDGRNRPPHLRPWRDGWRTLRFMLIHAPTWLFIFPGLALLFAGMIFASILISGPVKIGAATLDIHTLLVMHALVVLGVQSLFTGLFVSLYGHLVGVLPINERYKKTVRFFSLEKLIVVAIVLGLSGIWLFGRSFWNWYANGFPPLDASVTMRQVIPALTLITLSAQCMLNGFMLSTLFLATRKKSAANTWD